MGKTTIRFYAESIHAFERRAILEVPGKKHSTPFIIPRLHPSLISFDLYSSFISGMVKNARVPAIVVPGDDLLPGEGPSGSSRPFFEGIARVKFFVPESPGGRFRGQDGGLSGLSAPENRLELHVLRAPYPDYYPAKEIASEVAARMIRNLDPGEIGDAPVGVEVPHPVFLEVFGDYLAREASAWAVVVKPSGRLRPYSPVFNEFIRDLSWKVRPDVLRIWDGPISPLDVPLLVLAGFDGFIERGVLSMASRGILILGDHLFDVSALKEYPCSCRWCREREIETGGGGLTRESILALYLHDMDALIQAAWKTGEWAREQVLRDKVEAMVHGSVPWLRTLATLDQITRQEGLEWVSLHRKSRIHLTGAHSYHRPVVEKFRQKVINDFHFSSNTEHVLLLPCSATKPYRLSPSHRKIHGAMDKGWPGWRSCFEELVITSPLGVVPRPLETCFPAAHYDVPVTGYWDEKELEIAATMLVAIFSKAKEEQIPIKSVIAHVDGGYRKACELVEPDIPFEIVYTFSNDRVVSPGALSGLTETMRSLHEDGGSSKDGGKRASSRERILDEFRALVDFQFGTRLGHALVRGGERFRRIHGGVPYLFDGKEPLLHQDLSTGSIVLDLAGIKAAWKLRHGEEIKLKTVKFNGNSLKGSSLFA